VVACDVGQGDALLIRSADHVALVDTGPEPDALTRCLERFGVERVHLLVLTHFDLDHRGGLDALTGRVDVALHGPARDAESAAVVEQIRRWGTRTVSAHAEISGRLGGASWRILWPRDAGTPFDGNDASVVAEFSGGGVPRTLLLGDLSATPQASLSG